jgi:hypothetical protein
MAWWPPSSRPHCPPARSPGKRPGRMRRWPRLEHLLDRWHGMRCPENAHVCRPTVFSEAQRSAIFHACSASVERAYVPALAGGARRIDPVGLLRPESRPAPRNHFQPAGHQPPTILDARAERKSVPIRLSGRTVVLIARRLYAEEGGCTSALRLRSFKVGIGPVYPRDDFSGCARKSLGREDEM